MMSKQVTITQADNGYVVSCYNEKGEMKEIAKTMADATKAAESMMNKKMDQQGPMRKGTITKE